MNRRQTRAAAKARGRDIPQVRRSASADSELRASVSHYQAGLLADSKQLCLEFLSREPKNVVALNLLGAIKHQEGDARQATELFGKAIALRPNYAEAHNNLGLALKDQGRLEEAVAAYHRALELKPDYPEAHSNLGIALSNQGKLEEAVAALWNAAPLRVEQEWTKWTARILEKEGVTVSRLRHDIEQAQYLVNVDRGNVLPAGYLEGLQEVALNIGSGKHDSVDGDKIKLTPEQINIISPAFRKIIHIHEARKISSGALNRENNWEEIQERYIAADPKIICIDDFLSGEALSSMQEFCLRSTIWKKEYENHYFGALMDKGFVGPLHFQIAQELKEKLPIIFGPHRLEQLWAFKYDSQVGSGVNLHADFAELNLNFWVTPDGANLDESSGGLLVYNISPPEDWTFAMYNTNQNNVLGKLIAEKSTTRTVIPYRANRAVLFDSVLVHESDEINFRDGYENRRVNLTYLFGKKLKGSFGGD